MGILDQSAILIESVAHRGVSTASRLLRRRRFSVSAAAIFSDSDSKLLEASFFFENAPLFLFFFLDLDRDFRRFVTETDLTLEVEAVESNVEMYL